VSSLNLASHVLKEIDRPRVVVEPRLELAIRTEGLLGRRQNRLFGSLHQNLGIDALLLADLFNHVLKGERALLHSHLPT
jgi:hypothetical protein